MNKQDEQDLVEHFKLYKTKILKLERKLREKSKDIKLLKASLAMHQIAIEMWKKKWDQFVYEGRGPVNGTR